MSNRDNKAAASEFRELFGIDFDEFTRQAPVRMLLALAEFAALVLSRLRRRQPLRLHWFD